MPRIDTVTAQTGPGTIRTGEVSPNSFGAQGFQSVTAFGQKLQEVGEKVQHAKDQVDLVNLSSEYELQLDHQKTAIAQTPDLKQHGELLQTASETIRENLLKQNPNVSSAVQTAFQNHTTKQYINKIQTES
jgi:hypothetical protein